MPEKMAPLNIAGRKVRVVFQKNQKFGEMDRGGHTYGGTYSNDVIRVSTAQTPNGVRAAFLHELLHHCVERGEAGVSKANEERVVGSIDGWLLLALRDNPHVVRWLFEDLL